MNTNFTVNIVMKRNGFKDFNTKYSADNLIALHQFIYISLHGHLHQNFPQYNGKYGYCDKLKSYVMDLDRHMMDYMKTPKTQIELIDLLISRICNGTFEYIITENITYTTIVALNPPIYRDVIDDAFNKIKAV